MSSRVPVSWMPLSSVDSALTNANASCVAETVLPVLWTPVPGAHTRLVRKPPGAQCNISSQFFAWDFRWPRVPRASG